MSKPRITRRGVATRCQRSSGASKGREGVGVTALKDRYGGHEGRYSRLREAYGIPVRWARGEGCAAAKLTEADVHEAFRLRRMGHTMKDVGGALGCTRQNIGSILRRRTWAHVEVEG